MITRSWASGLIREYFVLCTWTHERPHVLTGSSESDEDVEDAVGLRV